MRTIVKQTRSALRRAGRAVAELVAKSAPGGGAEMPPEFFKFPLF